MSAQAVTMPKAVRVIFLSSRNTAVKAIQTFVQSVLQHTAVYLHTRKNRNTALKHKKKCTPI